MSRARFLKAASFAVSISVLPLKLIASLMTMALGEGVFCGIYRKCQKKSKMKLKYLIAVPCGFTADGLPSGFQLMGRPFSEAQLFQLGHAYQSATDWHERVPDIST